MINGPYGFFLFVYSINTSQVLFKIVLLTKYIIVTLFADVLLQMLSVGICGTDVSIWQKARVGHHTIALNDSNVTGHEGCGRVVKCGKNVQHLKPGTNLYY